MGMQFLKCCTILFLLSTSAVFPVYAVDDAVKSSKPSDTERARLEKAIAPDFKVFHPSIIDTKTFDVLTVVHLGVKAADHSDAYVIVTPDNHVIDVDNYAILSSIDIKKNSKFSLLAEKNPNISIWPGYHEYPQFEKLTDGTLQLSFNYRLLNGCHACAVGGAAIIGFHFDPAGNFLGATLLDLLPPSTVTDTSSH